MIIFIWHNFSPSGIIVFLSFLLMFWATVGKFVNENDQLFPKLLNFVSIQLYLSIYNETMTHLFSVIGAIKSKPRNSLAVYMADTMILKEGCQKSKRRNLSTQNLNTKILSARILSTTWAKSKT